VRFHPHRLTFRVATEVAAIHGDGLTETRRRAALLHRLINHRITAAVYRVLHRPGAPAGGSAEPPPGRSHLDDAKVSGGGPAAAGLGRGAHGPGAVARPGDHGAHPPAPHSPAARTAASTSTPAPGSTAPLRHGRTGGLRAPPLRRIRLTDPHTSAAPSRLPIKREPTWRKARLVVAHREAVEDSPPARASSPRPAASPPALRRWLRRCR
jgi:hypothetical protein